MNRLLKVQVDELRRERLREQLRAGYESEVKNDLEIALEFRFVDDEIARQQEN